MNKLTKTTATITFRTAFDRKARVDSGTPTAGLRAVRRTGRNFRQVEHTNMFGEVSTPLAADVTFAGETRTVVNRGGGDGAWFIEWRSGAIK